MLRRLVDSGNALSGQHSALALGTLLTATGDPADLPTARAALRYAADGQDRDVAARAGAALAAFPGVAADGDADAGIEEAAAVAYEAAEEALAGGDESALRALVVSGGADHGSRAALRLAELALDRGDLDDTRRLLEAAVAHGHPDHAGPAYRLLGGVLDDLGEPESAHAAYLRAAEDFRPQVRLAALISAGQVRAALGDLDGARAS